MTLHCVRCHKPIVRAAAQAGAYVWGPKCARMAGLVQRRRKAAEPVQRDDRTRDLFEGVVA